MRQLKEKVEFLVAWREEKHAMRVHGQDFDTKHPGVPQIQKLVELTFQMETCKSQAVDGTLYRPGHATRAYGTVADISLATFYSLVLDL